MKTKLEIAKSVIKEHIQEADCGIFNSRNVVHDRMDTLYDDYGLKIDICYGYAYFEVFGLSDEDFVELRKFYYSVLRGM